MCFWKQRPVVLNLVSEKNWSYSPWCFLTAASNTVSDGHCLGSPPACLETRVLDNPICAPAGSLQNHHVSDFLLISNLFQGEEDCRGERPDPHRHTTVLHNFRTRDTHSLLRFSRPVKAPLVSSIVPEMSLWSSSLGRGQEKAHNQCLNPRVIIQNKQKLWEWQRASFPFPRDTQQKKLSPAAITYKLLFLHWVGVF